MATLAGNLRTPDSDAVVEGTITLVATMQRDVGGATLVRIAYPIEVENSTYSKAGIPSGEYDVLERLESDGIHGTEKGYRVVVPDGDGTYSLRGLRDIYTGTPPTPSELEALIAFLQADAAATYVRSVNGIPVDPVTGNVEVEAGGDGGFSDTVLTYYPDGNVQTVTEGGVTTTYTYNPDDTVDTDERAGVTRQYTYDGDGNLTGIEAI